MRKIVKEPEASAAGVLEAHATFRKGAAKLVAEAVNKNLAVRADALGFQGPAPTMAFASADSFAEESVAEAKRLKANRIKRLGSPARQLARALDEAEAMRVAGDWSRAQARHLVAVYAMAHKRTYGVEAIELADAFAGAVSAARRLLDTEFKNKAEDAVDFLGWVWQREGKTEKRRRQSEDPGTFRISWRYMFVSRNLVTEYRIAMKREAGR